MESGNPLLDDYVLGLTRAERPRAGLSATSMVTTSAAASTKAVS